MRMKFLYTVITVTLLLFAPGIARSHCDTLDGPVIMDAKKALDTENVNLVLIWVQKKDEAEIRKAFEETLSMRKLNPQAKGFADRYFFETLVRIHRAGEGAAYTGLQPAGQDLDPAIAAADKAVTSGSIESAKQLLVHTVEEGLMQRFDELKAKQNYDKNDVAAGREYVAAYVQFIHYLEGVHSMAVKGADHSTQSSEHAHP